MKIYYLASVFPKTASKNCMKEIRPRVGASMAFPLDPPMTTTHLHLSRLSHICLASAVVASRSFTGQGQALFLTNIFVTEFAENI